MKSGRQENFHNHLLKSKRTLKKICRFLIDHNCDYRVKQTRHIKISIKNRLNNKETFLILAVSPSDVNFEQAFIKKATARLHEIDVDLKM